MPSTGASPPHPLRRPPARPPPRRICNQDIIGRVKQVICFAFHDSALLLETCQEARNESRVVTLFYLD